MRLDKKLKKKLLLNAPYVLFIYLFDKVAQGIRLAPGSDASQKLLHLADGFGSAFASPLPSIHPIDLLIGVAGAVIMWVVVYVRGKNAKKFRKNTEYGSARWGTPEDIEPYMDPDFRNNIILTQTERLTMNSRPKDPKTARNKNVLVIGGSGSGKTRFFVKPQLMQLHSSYVVTDPKGSLLVECGRLMERAGYKIKVFNTINFKKSMHYNPFAYIHSEKDTEEKTPELSRSTEEVQAESISYAVCAYYGIATGDNSFGYIASWSKDKTLPELRESLEVISKTADGLINDIDRHYAEILKEREEELIATEPAMAMERLYAVDERYLHVQRTDTGVDYTIYDKASMKEIDGGQLDMEISTLAESALEICNSHGIGQNAPLQVADIGILDELQAAQDAAIAIEPPVQENPEPETDIPPDPAISVEARNAYGYTDDAMLPLTKERAMELFERDVPVYLLYGDNTEAMAFEQTEILNHDGIFGIDRADWEAVKEQFPVITENRWQKAFQQNPADSYCIYQLRRDPELAELRFMNSQYLREHGLEPAFDHYIERFSDVLPAEEGVTIPERRNA